MSYHAILWSTISASIRGFVCGFWNSGDSKSDLSDGKNWRLWRWSLPESCDPNPCLCCWRLKNLQIFWWKIWPESTKKNTLTKLQACRFWPWIFSRQGPWKPIFRLLGTRVTICGGSFPNMFLGTNLQPWIAKMLGTLSVTGSSQQIWDQNSSKITWLNIVYKKLFPCSPNYANPSLHGKWPNASEFIWIWKGFIGIPY